MFTFTISVDSFATYIVAADVLILLSYVLYLFHKRRRLNKSFSAVSNFITGYFSDSGAEVQVTCFKPENDIRIIVLIETEPLKRFRCSNVIEGNLIAHVLKNTGYQVDKIYWRFPVPHTKETLIAEEDLYFLDGDEQAKIKDEYQVDEVSWLQFDSTK
jgi:hypothetical protein